MYKRICIPCGAVLHLDCLGLQEEHDPCIANTPNTHDACCGHGCLAEMYVHFDNNLTLYDRAALRFFRNQGYSLVHYNIEETTPYKCITNCTVAF